MNTGNGKSDLQMRVPVLGQVFAGRAVPIEALPITSWREIRSVKGARPGDRFVAAPVVGDSMEEDHILDGDIVIFRVTQEAKPGEMVIALTPDGLTLKYIYPLDEHTVVLRGADPQYDQVWESRLVKVQGVVKRIERDL